MPGYANWKQFYQEEYFQMKEEGFDLTGIPAPEDVQVQLPLPVNPGEQTLENEAEWEKAYGALWARYDAGISPAYPYEEPNELTKIFMAAAPVPDLGEPVRGEEYRRRVAGAFGGRCAAVVLGKPL